MEDSPYQSPEIEKTAGRRGSAMAGALRWRNIVLLGVVMLLSVVGLSVYRILDMYERIPEAYAAWDTGTLLVAYMEQHDGKWPKSWDDLLTVLDSPAGQQIPVRGAQSGDRTYVRSLAHMIQKKYKGTGVIVSSNRGTTC